MLSSVMAFVIGIWNYKHFENYLASRLFKILLSGSEDKSNGEEIKPTRFLNVFECMYDSVPKFLTSRCCRKPERMRAIEKAR